MTGVECAVAWDVVQPVRVVLDSELNMPLTAQMAKLAGRRLVFDMFGG